LLARAPVFGLTMVMVGFTVAHVAVGALTMATSVVLSIQVFRNVRRPMPAMQTARIAVPS